MYETIEKRLIEALSDKVNYTPSIRELARELNCTPKLINTRFIHLAGKLILKRKAEIRNMNNRKTLNNEFKGSWFVRNCLACDSEFKAVNKFNRLCDSCKNKEYLSIVTGKQFDEIDRKSTRLNSSHRL